MCTQNAKGWLPPTPGFVGSPSQGWQRRSFPTGALVNMLYWTLWVSLKKRKGYFVYTFVSPESDKNYMSTWLRPLNMNLRLLIVPTFNGVTHEL